MADEDYHSPLDFFPLLDSGIEATGEGRVYYAPLSCYMDYRVWLAASGGSSVIRQLIGRLYFRNNADRWIEVASRTQELREITQARITEELNAALDNLRQQLVNSGINATDFAESETKRLEAEERSKQLFYSLLTKTQIESWEQNGYIDIVTKKHHYRLYDAHNYNVYRVHDGANHHTKICTVPSIIVPKYDQYSSQLLMLLTDEKKFMDISFRHSLSDWEYEYETQALRPRRGRPVDNSGISA